MSDNTWPDPARPGVPLNPERDGWHWVQRIDKGFVPNPRIILWTDDWSSGQFFWDAVGYQADEQKLGRDFRYLGPALTPAEADARVSEARRDVLEEAAQFVETHTYVTTNSALKHKLVPYARAKRGLHHATIAAAIRALKGEGND
jgi:hypothetical protein